MNYLISIFFFCVLIIKKTHKFINTVNFYNGVNSAVAMVNLMNVFNVVNAFSFDNSHYHS